MNDEEKLILINILFDEYNKTHNIKIIEIIDKIRNANHIFKRINLNNCSIKNVTEKPINTQYTFCKELKILYNNILYNQDNIIEIIGGK